MKTGDKAMSQDVLSRMEKAGIIPIVIIDDPSKASQLGRTILDAGLDLIEITLRTEKAMDTIKALSKEFPDLLVGAGTVFSVPVAKEALAAGARFIVSPHLDEAIVTYCTRNNIVSMPGVFTPSEIQKAIKAAAKGAPRKKHQRASIGNQGLPGLNRRPRPHSRNESCVPRREIPASWRSQCRQHSRILQSRILGRGGHVDL